MSSHTSTCAAVDRFSWGRRCQSVNVEGQWLRVCRNFMSGQDGGPGNHTLSLVRKFLSFRVLSIHPECRFAREAHDVNLERRIDARVGARDTNRVLDAPVE